MFKVRGWLWLCHVYNFYNNYFVYQQVFVIAADARSDQRGERRTASASRSSWRAVLDSGKLALLGTRDVSNICCVPDAFRFVCEQLGGPKEVHRWRVSLLERGIRRVIERCDGQVAVAQFGQHAPPWFCSQFRMCLTAREWFGTSCLRVWSSIITLLPWEAAS